MRVVSRQLAVNRILQLLMTGYRCIAANTASWLALSCDWRALSDDDRQRPESSPSRGTFSGAIGTELHRGLTPCGSPDRSSFDAKS